MLSGGVGRTSTSGRHQWRRYHRCVLLEFTVEPFVEGHPGPHVTAAVAAVEALGAKVEFGPFGSTCTVDADRCADIAAAVLRAAFANGATHVSLHAAHAGAGDAGAGDAGAGE